MRLLINTALTVLFSLGLLLLLTQLYRRVGGTRRSFSREFLLGVLAALVVVLTRVLLGAVAWQPLGTASLMVGVAALTEETGKLAALGLSRIRRGSFGAQEAVSAAAALGLGFALVENSFYITDETLLLLFRGFTAVPLHAVAAGFLGWGVASPFRTTRLVPAFLAAVLLHAAYNTMIATGGLLAPITVVLIGIGAALLLAITPAAD